MTQSQPDRTRASVIEKGKALARKLGAHRSEANGKRKKRKKSRQSRGNTPAKGNTTHQFRLCVRDVGNTQ
jgi:hypothetical protein